MSDYHDEEDSRWKKTDPPSMDFSIEDPIASEYYKLMQGASMITEAMPRDKQRTDFINDQMVPLFAVWKVRVERFAKILSSSEKDV